MNGFFLLRIVYVIICWIILLAPIHSSNNLATICSSFLLYYIPFCFDYWSHEPLTVTKNDRFRRRIGVIAPAILSGVCISIVILNSQGLIVHNGLISYIKYGIWVISFGFVYLAIKDFIAYSDNEEIETRQQRRQEYRKNFETKRMDMGKREEYYKKAKTKQYVVRNSKKNGRKRR
ncbi:hypothetical protein [Rummeliibacillus suwonensis]|uniref:hypothetical protein n=1 Tax=Rummeliibacillus suwonensis TaxID=1306154 RepID=UPI0011B3B5E5|nr:hypothetical protein [Rummeliibacillus suwonensis]